jgi:serine/threonine-protein kinase RsbW
MLYKAGYIVSSDLTALNELQAWFRRLCHSSEAQWSELEDTVYRINLALAEGFTNAVRHAHAGLPIETSIEVQVSLADNQVEIQIWDAGRPFNPDTLEEPLPGTLRLGGYGWFLLRRLMDKVSYDRAGDRNCLHMVKSCRSEAGREPLVAGNFPSKNL